MHQLWRLRDSEPGTYITLARDAFRDSFQWVVVITPGGMTGRSRVPAFFCGGTLAHQRHYQFGEVAEYFALVLGRRQERNTLDSNSV